MFVYKPDTIGFIKKKQCEGRCDFCGISSTGYSSDELGPGTIKDCITQAYELGIGSVGLTGGEPFDLNEVVDIMRHSTSKGMPPRLMTNGSYAKTLEEGERYAESLKKAGASMIRVSVDATHAKTVPYECSLNAVLGALNQDLDVMIASGSMMSTAVKSSRILKRLAKELGGGIYDYKKKPGFTRIIARDRQVPIHMSFINNVGRARNLDRDEFFWYKPDPYEGCKTNQIIVNSNGNIIPCDSMYSLELDGVYAAGNIHDTKLSDAMNWMNNNSMVAFLRGPEGGKRLLDILESSPDPNVRRIAREDVTKFCEVCTKAMRNESARKMIEKEMD